jgi:uncharacterized protein
MEDEVRQLLPRFGTHGFEHTERVHRLSRLIGIKEGADLSILLPAALMHDIERASGNHAVDSAARARTILASMNYEAVKVEAIVEAISSHSFSGGKSPASLEAKILSDADKLDAMGASGCYRAAMFCAERGRTVEDFLRHFQEKLLNLRDLMFTDEAKRLATERNRFMLDFLAQMRSELELDA